jgi:nucleoid-associated protein EbfC
VVNVEESKVFNKLSGLVSLVKQAQEIGGRMRGVQDELRAKRATGTAGGGLVEVEVNGLSEVIRVRIDPQLISQNDRELLEDLVLTAVNQAQQKGREVQMETMRTITGGLPLPGIDEALGGILGGLPPEPGAEA